jgi:hypothetical protein
VTDLHTRLVAYFRLAEQRFALLRGKLARSHPKLARGRVWCLSCGASRVVDSAVAMRVGWPTCCGATMTIDGPGERG